MFISLSASYAGNACAVKQSIDNYHIKGPTLFFDWLVCSMKSINDILDGGLIEFDISRAELNSANQYSVPFMGVDLLLSHHDFNAVDNNSVDTICNKYKRRYDRLIQTIKDNTNIYFIRYFKDMIEEDEIVRFYKNIYKINPNSKFKFICITDSTILHVSDLLHHNQNFIFINLNDHTNDDVINETNDYFKILKQYKCIYDIIKI